VTNPRVLVAFHSSEGQTEKIAEHIGDILELQGARPDVVDADADPSPDDYDGVVVGDSIHVGHHSPSLVKWLLGHAADLDGRPTALFQVSLVSANRDADHTAAAERLVQELRDETGFAPDEVAMFAGALAYTKYGWLTRRVLRSIAAKERGSTDMSKDHEYTDWADVEHFAHDFFATLASRPSRARPDGVSP
jgi:menaquinone-dependent protoporphyrinogen oxidase